MTNIRIVRSASTGKYHSSSAGTNTIHCNYSGQVRVPRLVAATASDIKRASAEAFCRKCFPAGKPRA